MRFSPLLAIAGLALGSIAGAQAPDAGPLVLLLPASARTVAFGGAPVRDDYSIFSDPARITPSNGVGASFARYESNATFGALASTVNVGPLNWGWGAELVQYRACAGCSYPLSTDQLVQDGARIATSLAAAVAVQYTLKGFSTGISVKVAQDRIDALESSLGYVTQPAIEQDRLLADIGTTHRFLGGTAELAVQNIGDRSKYPVPTLAKLGFNRSVSTDQVDFNFAAVVTERQRWVGGGGGAEVSYGWIEGFSAALRVGATRPETSAQKPVAIGGTLNADRLQLDYALQFFDGNRYAHFITVRWR